MMRKSIQAINESTKPLVPPNDDNSTPTGRKKGDTIKLIGSFSGGMDKGNFYRLVNVSGEPRNPNDPSKGTLGYNFFRKVLKRTGEFSGSMRTGIAISDRNMDILLKNSKVLEPNKPYDQGEITLDEIKDALTILGVPRLLKANFREILEENKSSIRIRITSSPYTTQERVSDSIRRVVFNKILRYLKKADHDYSFFQGFKRSDDFDKVKGYADTILIQKGGD